MLEQVKRLTEILEKEISLHSGLLKLLKEEQTILVDLQFENLEENLLSQFDCVEQIKIQEEGRIKLVDEIKDTAGNGNGEMNVDLILELVEDEREKEKLSYAKDRLKELLRDINKINDSNDFLIKNSLSFIEKNIKLILEGTDKEQFYGETNKKKKNVHGKVLDWKV